MQASRSRLLVHFAGTKPGREVVLSRHMSINDITRMWWQSLKCLGVGFWFWGKYVVLFIFSHFTLGFFNLFSVPWSVIYRLESSSWYCDILWGLCGKVPNDHVDKQQTLSKRKTWMWLSRPAEFLNLSGEKNLAGFSRTFQVTIKSKCKQKTFLALDETRSIWPRGN